MDDIIIECRLGRIAEALERIADVLERINDDDDDRDPSDGPFLAQEPEEPDGFADRPDFDSEDFEQ